MRIIETPMPGVLLIEPRVFRDRRGTFVESWRRSLYAEHGITDEFLQDNVSWSKRGVLRGLHFQDPEPQAKLISTVYGTIFDVAVDVRRGSATFGDWYGVELSAEMPRLLYLPVGFAHGFVVLSAEAAVSYKCSNYYSPVHERTIRWNDPSIAIRWPIENPVLSEKDASAPLLGDVFTQP